MASIKVPPTEYHHFVPQFILRNFSHKYYHSSRNSKTTSGSRKRNKKNQLHPGEPALHVIDLKHEIPQLSESPVKRTFGLMDMYQDITNTADHNFLEKEIGKLESRVSSLIADIRKASESGKSGFSMSRQQRDMLRKFLFIMKYRGPGFHRRFHGDESGQYKEDDADQFERYMQEQGYKSPVEVWSKSIKTILNLTMDLQGQWQETLLSSIYPDDAMWFIMHTEWYFMAFCTPSDPSSEFVLTENCYNVHEGPNSTALNPSTDEWEVTSWTSYHEFSPISPKLILILRSVLLPNEEEDASESIREWRRQIYETSRNSHANPATAISSLEDLPIRKPRNSYSQRSSQGIEFLPGEDGSRRSHHRFTFPFFKLDTNQIKRINCIFLDNAHLTSEIVFNSASSLRESLQYYLELPADQGYKLVHRQKNDARLVYIKKLETIINTLGSTVSLVYKQALCVDDMEKLKASTLKQLQEDMLKHLPEQPTEFMQLYNTLGGTHDTFFTDMEQAGKMRFLRIKIDVCTQGFREAIREKVRENLRDIFCQLPARRLWLYLKSLRVMSLGSPGSPDEIMSNESMDGPEDVIVKASQVVRPECLGLLLHFTVMQDIQHRKNPGLGPSSNFEFDETGLQRLRMITNLTFAPVGSIRDCGIRCIQDAAIAQTNMLRFTGMYKEYMNPIWSVDENIEVLTRSFLRDDMRSILAGQLPEGTLEELSDVLFNVVYPAYTDIQKE
ncbi:uncharacterized protein K460DRAFT_276406 [Cucurbitaria berberidis CBS 394.84]|uniref:DUF4238 domain-containing protein n=1 Tax=Cucurbitaria berberidis CBS 394.84 TaxID=1168544 RepID=A0A9P4GL81_9PLEO|nr:uncharacterized protein K460DRAFT_276406 [Cucurbitaria berberidis CBS 394.84]KAF1847287.1 hypothetical protein K460DRAFT_276406 [Cucurbitaria berberidis CBS 394.84]